MCLTPKKIMFMQHGYFPKIPLKATYLATHKKPNSPSYKGD